MFKHFRENFAGLFGSPRPIFPMRQFGTVEDVARLKHGEAVLIHKHIIQQRYKNTNSARASLRHLVNGNGTHLWVTTTKRGHLLVYAKSSPSLTLTR